MTTPTTLKVRYFAWVREKIGRAEDDVSVPANVATVADLVAWLSARGPEYASAFERAEVIRAAVDQTHASRTASIRGAREVAFFPPVTGG